MFSVALVLYPGLGLALSERKQWQSYARNSILEAGS